MAKSSLAEKIEPEVSPVEAWEVVVSSASCICTSGRDAGVTLVATARGVRMLAQEYGPNLLEAALKAAHELMPADVQVERPELSVTGQRVEARVIASRGNVCVIGRSRNPDPALAVAKAYFHALLQLDKGPK